MWQAQLQGNKSWTLSPAPECDRQCNGFSFYVEPGDAGIYISIIFDFKCADFLNLVIFAVLIDTRFWYHGTTVTNGQFSLTIQSEYG